MDHVHHSFAYCVTAAGKIRPKKHSKVNVPGINERPVNVSRIHNSLFQTVTGNLEIFSLEAVSRE